MCAKGNIAAQSHEQIITPECGHSNCRKEKDDFLFSEAESHKPAAGLQIRVSSELKVRYSKAAPSVLNLC